MTITSIIIPRWISWDSETVRRLLLSSSSSYSTFISFQPWVLGLGPGSVRVPLSNTPSPSLAFCSSTVARWGWSPSAVTCAESLL